MTYLFAYEDWPSRLDVGWEIPGAPGPKRGDNPYDNIDFHVDLGCGKLPKARIGLDRHPAEGVAIVADLDPIHVYGMCPEPGQDAVVGAWPGPPGRRLPFEDSSIKSIISHHAFEHIGIGFIPLVDEIWRVLEPDGILRAITPLFPSSAAVEDPDHKRYFMAHDGGTCTWDAFCGTRDNHWHDSFSVPYAHARFEKMDQDLTPPRRDPADWWGPNDARELRVALRAVK